MSLTANEPISQPIVTIGSIDATTVTGSGTDWQASRTLTAADPGGAIEFTVEYADLAGNEGVPAFESTDGSTVAADGTPPTLTNVTIASDNADAGLAKAGDVITVTLAADEPIVAPTVQIGG